MTDTSTPKPKRKPPKNNAANSKSFRERKAAAGLTQVRGLWAQPDQHDAIRAFCAALRDSRAQGANVPPVVDSVGGVGESAHPL